MKKLLLFLLLLQGALGTLGAETFHLANHRAPVTSLDGLWRFHPGDNQAWADPAFDDSQ